MKPAMQIRFWGVRGSVPSPGPDTALVGGNTSCVELVCGDDRIVLDAGTGLRGLGQALLAETKTRGKSVDATMLLSHYHWDHIQGLPFFVPVYLRESALTIVGAGSSGVIREALERQMSAPVFPVKLDDAGARIATREVKVGDVFEVGRAGVTVRAGRGNHPGGVVAWRIEHAGASVVYATDTEHYACVDPALHKLAEGADVLIYDAQYTPEEYAAKVGWGHSTYVAGAELAAAAGVGRYVLFHHDPARSDAGVADLERRAQALFPRTIAAREGLVLAVGGPGQKAEPAAA
jgi:phosphoribosyl 1,2-cyclic phosphodiesterase